MRGAAPVPDRVVGAFVAKGFRPFFLAAGIFGALIVPVWLLALFGFVRVDGFLDPVNWHAHEMVFGFTVAAIAGFLLTAVGNWTGRETAIGGHLTALTALWVLGRVALLSASVLPKPIVLVVELSFLPALFVTLARPLIRTGNARNYIMLVVLGALFLLDLVMCLDAVGVLAGIRQRASLAAVDLATLLIVIIATRIFPMFTRNATGVDTIKNVPKLDASAIVAVALFTISELFAPGKALFGVLALAAAALTFARSLTWGARSSIGHPLLWILHLGHAWIVVGLALRGLSVFVPAVPAASGLHALTAGAIGCTTVGMMSRVALGHTGRQLAPSSATVAAFYFIVFGAAIRVAGPFAPSLYRGALVVAGGLWTVGFAAFTLGHARMLVEPRVDGKPG